MLLRTRQSSCDTLNDLPLFSSWMESFFQSGFLGSLINASAECAIVLV